MNLNSYRVTVRTACLAAVRDVLRRVGAVEWSAKDGGANAERDHLAVEAALPGADPRLAELLALVPERPPTTTLLVDARHDLARFAGVLHEPTGGRHAYVTLLQDMPIAELYGAVAAAEAYRAADETPSYRACCVNVDHLRPIVGGMSCERVLLIGPGGLAATEIAFLRLLRGWPMPDGFVAVEELSLAASKEAIDRLRAEWPQLRVVALPDVVSGSFDLATILGYTIGHGDETLQAASAWAPRVVLDAPLADRANDPRASGDLPPDVVADEEKWLAAACGGVPRYHVVDASDGYEIRGVYGDRIVVRYRRRTPSGWRLHFRALGWDVAAEHVTATTRPIATYLLRRR